MSPHFLRKSLLAYWYAWFHALSAVFVFAAVTCPVRAQDYPTRPIRLVVPGSPGGAGDIIARLVARKFNEMWEQPVVVDNRGGGANMIAIEIVSKAPPGGYTLLLGNFSFAVLPSLSRKLPYDTVRDFTPIGLIAKGPLALVVTPTLPVKSVKELVALAKAKPGQLNYASVGAGSPTGLGGELFRSLTGVEIVPITYNGAGPGLIDLIAGRVHAMFPSIATVISNTGKLRALAVTSEKRSNVMPDLPTMVEAGVPGYIVVSWYGILAPTRTPRSVIAKLNAALNRSMEAADVRDKLIAQGLDPAPGSSEEFSEFIAAEMAKWGGALKASGAQVD